MTLKLRRTCSEIEKYPSSMENMNIGGYFTCPIVIINMCIRWLKLQHNGVALQQINLHEQQLQKRGKISIFMTI